MDEPRNLEMTQRRTIIAAIGAALLARGRSVRAAEPTKETNALKIAIEFEGALFHASLEDNATTRALLAKLPLTIDFLDLYGRELCHRFDEPLPAEEVRMRGYEAGEIIYWPPRRSFVIMYRQNGERFEMQTVGRLEGDLALLPKRDCRAVMRAAE